jgi:hypothetical protein
MKWTTKPPSSPGLYIWAQYEYCKLFDVVDVGGELLVNGQSLSNFVGSWFGPLPAKPISLHMRCPSCGHEWPTQYDEDDQKSHIDLIDNIQ